jgi:glycosyltransferase involved in cell wall biosynthesis
MVLEHLAQSGRLDAAMITDGWRPDTQEDKATAWQVVQAPTLPRAASAYAAKLYWEQVGLRYAAWRLRARVLYSPYFSAPLLSPCPTVISVHDLIPLTEPGYAPGLHTRLYFGLVCAAARQAAAVLTLSEFARREIHRLLGIPEQRIHVVVPGVDQSFRDQRDPRAEQRARTRYGLPAQYLLYVGGADKRKNIGVLLEAVARLKDHPGLPPLVVVAGLPKEGQSVLFPDWRAQADHLRLGSAVQFVERVEEEDLPAVYRLARGFCFPSRAEGFGLPPLEAMACGTPVVCANTSSLPEAVGDAGILVPHDQPEAWARAMVEVCSNGDLAARLREAGMQRARIFRWDSTARKVEEIILQVAQCAF